MFADAAINYIVGFYDVALGDGAKGTLIDELIKRKIYFMYVGNDIRIRKRDHDILSSEGLLDDAGIGRLRGVPAIIGRYGKRYGLYAGAVIFVLLVILSQRVVWNIEVVGCDEESKERVMDNLEELGFTYGTDFKKIDLDKLHNDYLRFHDDLAWIFINMTGTWARVEVKELSLPDEEDNGSVMNVVASEAGRITAIEPHEGKPMVKIGDFVAKGDLLLGGIIAVGEEGVRYEPSDGHVFAEVIRTYEDKIPKTRSEKVYTGREKTENSLIFFKNEIKLSGKGRISYEEYDTIYCKERYSLFGVLPLPVFRDDVVYREYRTESTPVSKEEAGAEFDRRRQSVTEDVLGGAELVGIETEDGESENEYVRRYRISCIADIAVRKRIDIQMTEGENDKKDSKDG